MRQADVFGTSNLDRQPSDRICLIRPAPSLSLHLSLLSNKFQKNLKVNPLEVGVDSTFVELETAARLP